MPTDKDKWEKAAQKLLRDTKNGRLTWEREPRITRARDNVVTTAFVTEVSGKRVTVYEYQYKHYIDEDTYEWQSDVSVEFVSSDGELEWRWPDVPSRFGLLDSVRRHDSGADAFLEGLLTTDDDE